MESLQAPRDKPPADTTLLRSSQLQRSLLRMRSESENHEGQGELRLVLGSLSPSETEESLFVEVLPVSVES
jgi:hypothetical protein